MNIGGEWQGPGGRKVLVVDDEVMVLTVVGRLLRNGGHDVFLAADADQAWRCPAADEIDIIILDAHLRGVTAAQCLAGLRERGVDAPVITFSGYPAQPGTFDAMPEADRPRMHVMKPVTGQELCAAVARVLSQRGAA